VHHLNISVTGVIWVAFTYVEVSKNLVPDALFHKKADFKIKLRKKSAKAIIFAAPTGN
jgi:hypothetical protein